MVGPAVGRAVGPAVGPVIGPAEGPAVGPVVGPVVGFQVGAVLGSLVGSGVIQPIGDKVFKGSRQVLMADSPLLPTKEIVIVRTPATSILTSFNVFLVSEKGMI